MRRLPMVLAGVAVVVGLAAPAQADNGEGREGHTVTAHRRGDDRDRPRRFHSASDDAPGEGRSHYDREQHDDPAILF